MCIVECWEIIAAVGVSVGFLEFLVCLQCWELDCILQGFDGPYVVKSRSCASCRKIESMKDDVEKGVVAEM